VAGAWVLHHQGHEVAAARLRLLHIVGDAAICHGAGDLKALPAAPPAPVPDTCTESRPSWTSEANNKIKTNGEQVEPPTRFGNPEARLAAGR
jgi:hypothetical protein